MASTRSYMPPTPPPIRIEDAASYQSVTTEQTTGGHVWAAAEAVMCGLLRCLASMMSSDKS